MSIRAVVANAVMTSRGRLGDAIVVENGVVREVTTRDRLGDLPRVEHSGSTLVPAFIDSHIHPIGYAALVTGTSLKEADGIDDLVARVAEAAADVPALMAQRFDDAGIGRMPTRHDLDRAAPGRPVLAYRYCGHVAVANTAALDLAGIGPDTIDPRGGSLDRDDSGLPTGVLRETAIGLVSGVLDPLIPPPSDHDILVALGGLVACGLGRITAIVAAGEPLWCGVGNELAALCRIAGELPLDVDVLVTAGSPAELEQAAGRVRSAGRRLAFLGWKEFADGSFGGHTAAMREPFADHASTGTLRLDPDHAELMATTAHDLGGVAAIHAIGDHAIDVTLGVYERLVSRGRDPRRMRLEHVSVVDDGAITRLGSLGVVASVQPAFLTSEAGWVRRRLGEDRGAYRFASMARAGVVMIGGSDCPVERPDPLVGVAAAVHRRGWHDHEEVGLETALDWFTTSPARLLGLAEPLTGGSPADFVAVRGLGDSDAEVEAVYLDGAVQDYPPVVWPG